MTDAVSLRRANGLDRPRYFDRQLLIADDLSLEQGFADRRLALMARHTLGWGVAAGLCLSTRPLSPAAGAVDLAVSPGYALTPNGDEVYLSQEIILDDIAAAIITTCGTPADCQALEAGRPVRPTRAWIIARPAPLDGGPRPAMPEACGHPGNTLRPSRRCGGAVVEIACALLPPHDAPLPGPEPLQHDVCGPWGPPLAPEVSAAANYVVLGAIEIVPEGVFATPRNRRIIPRLDHLGRLVCSLHHPRTRYVTHIQRDQEDEDRAIDRLAGYDGAGTLFVETLDQAIAQIGEGTVYETLPHDFPGRKLLIRRRKSRTYLQTEGDSKPPNDLLSLPEIRDTWARRRQTGWCWGPSRRMASCSVLPPMPPPSSVGSIRSREKRSRPPWRLPRRSCWDPSTASSGSSGSRSIWCSPESCSKAVGWPTCGPTGSGGRWQRRWQAAKAPGSPGSQTMPNSPPPIWSTGSASRPIPISPSPTSRRLPTWRRHKRQESCWVPGRCCSKRWRAPAPDGPIRRGSAAASTRRPAPSFSTGWKRKPGRTRKQRRSRSCRR